MGDSYVELNGLPVTSTGANTCLLNTSIAHLCNTCEPARLLIKPRTAAFDLAPFTGAGGKIPEYGSASQNALDPDPCFSGSRTSVSFDGPYIKYSIAAGSMSNKHTDGIMSLGVNNNSSFSFYFDLLTNRSILLPFPGSVDVITQYPGQWRFEWYLFRSSMADALSREGYPQLANHAVRARGPLDADATLTMRLASDGIGTPSSRTFNRMPPGAHSLTLNTTGQGAGPFSTATVQQQDAPAGGGAVGPAGQVLTTDVAIPIFGSSLASYMNRLGHGNAQRLKVTSGNNDESGLVQWHLSFG